MDLMLLSMECVLMDIMLLNKFKGTNIVYKVMPLIDLNGHYVVEQNKKKARIRNRNNPVPHLTQDTTLESDKNTRKHHLQESQEASFFKQVITRLQWTDKPAWQTQNINNKKGP